MRRASASLLPLAVLALAARVAFAASPKAFVFESDFSTGSFSAVDGGTHVPACDVASVSSDARVRWYNGLVYVVNRFGADNIQEIDPVTYATHLQFSVGNGSNPYDIAFASPTKAYVTRYETSDLWIVNPQTGAHTGTISLAAFADADGIPEMDHEEMVGPLLFVSLQRVDRNAGFAPTDSSLVVVVDTRADTVVDCDPAHPGPQAILLPRANPVTAFQFDHATSRLLLGCAGHYGAEDGGIVWVDPVALTAPGLAARADSLGGDVLDVVWRDGEKSYAVVSDPDFNTSLVSWSPVTGRRIATLDSPGGFTLADAELASNGELWVCHASTTAPGVRVFATATDTPVGGLITCTLPPQQLTFDQASGQVAGAVPAPPGAFALSAPWPNPADSPVRATLALARAAQVNAGVYDAAGRLVRTLARGGQPEGARSLVWDLADDAGRRVAPGVYFLRARSPEGDAARPVLVIR